MRDVSRRGNEQDKEEVDEILHQEMEEESKCVSLLLRGHPTARNQLARGVTARSGKSTETPEAEVLGMPAGTAGVGDAGGTKPQISTAPEAPVESNLPGLGPNVWLGGSDGDDESVEIEAEIEIPAETVTSKSPTVGLVNTATGTATTFSDIPTPNPKPAEMDFARLWEFDWGPECAKCPRWRSVCHGGMAHWPKGMKFLQSKI